MKTVKKLNQEEMQNIDKDKLLDNIIEAYNNHESNAEDFAYAICEILETTFGTVESFE